VRDVGRDRRLERGDPHEPQVLERRHERGEALVGGVVALHRADHQHDAGALGGGEHVAALGDAKGERLLHEHVLAALRRGDRDRRVAARGEDEDGVEVVGHEVLPAGERPRHAVALRQLPRQLRRDVAQRRDLVAVLELGEVGEMHDLRDETAAHHPDTRTVRHPLLRLRGTFHECRPAGHGLSSARQNRHP
jgi:hypothetical protein